MLVEIPDVGVILSIIASFVAGLVVIIVYNNIRPRLGSQANNTKILTERLQYYENLLIDMKIRLDSLELMKEGEEVPHVSIPKSRKYKVHHEIPEEAKEEKPIERIQNMNFGNATDYVLRLI